MAGAKNSPQMGRVGGEGQGSERSAFRRPKRLRVGRSMLSCHHSIPLTAIVLVLICAFVLSQGNFQQTFCKSTS